MNKQAIEEWVKNHIELSFSRSSGPGGQNVNKLNTKSTAKLPVSTMDILSEDEKNSVMTYLRNRINNKDEIVIQVQEQRSQVKNREIATERMISLILKALKKQKRRIKTKPTLSSKENRIKAKRIIGEKKRQRGKFDYNE